MNFFVFDKNLFYKIIFNKVFKNRKGALTVEAALVLPIFICAILTIGFLTKAVYTHEIVQNAINEAANEMASSSYIYYISGMNDIDKTINHEIDEKKRKSVEYANYVLDLYKDLNDIIQIQPETENIPNDSSNEMLSVIASISEIGANKGKTIIGNKLIKSYIKRHGLTDSRLKSLNIDRLDFSSSTYFENDEDIDVIVKYKINIPLPIKIVEHISIVQRATVRAWMGGDEVSMTSELDDVIEQGNKEDRIVYVSKKGSSYHRFGCYSIFKQIEALNLQAAKKLGLKPCKKCDPPTESRFGYTVFKSKRSNDGKYHKKGCTHLFKDIIKISIREAQEKYEPCKICKP